MFKSITYQLRNRLPIISILLIISNILSTIPQFFLSNTYSDITGQSAGPKSFYLFTLSAFTHDPSIIVNHFIGNLLVFICFGILTEIIIGSKRFACITAVTFFSTTIVNYLHTTNSYIGHGASGIAWGYHVFFIFILIVLYEQKKLLIFKDVFIILATALMTFDIIGIPFIEVAILKKGFFDNFGQVLHLVSMFVVVPFIFYWRAEIESNVKKLTAHEQIHIPSTLRSTSIVIIMILLILNAVGTYKAISLSQGFSGKITYNVLHNTGSDITTMPQKLVIKFGTEIKESQRTLTSIYFNDNTENVKIEDNWIDSKTLEIAFSRKFERNEKLKLIYKVSGELKDGIMITDEVVLEY